ncbi:UNVERIFIED_CONTAM: hypothetical protein RMT77_000912 [Armadillidium vulgare]
MASKNARKKLDFFNGGRGVDLTQFDTESNDASESFETDNREVERSLNNSNTVNEEPFNSFPPFAMSELTNSPPPITPTSPVPSQSPPYMHVPIPQYSRQPFSQFEYSDSSPHFSGGNFVPEIRNPSLGFHPFSPPNPHHPHYPHPPTLTTTNHFPHHPHPPPLFPPEPNYSGFIGSAYSPMRPMEANGLGGLAYYDPVQGIDHHPGALNIPRDDEMLKKKKRQQKCSLCSNHGICVDVKGHKWFCPFRNCECGRCEITRGRQHHMKEQQKLTRQLQRLQ